MPYRVRSEDHVVHLCAPGGPATGGAKLTDANARRLDRQNMNAVVHHLLKRNLPPLTLFSTADSRKGESIMKREGNIRELNDDLEQRVAEGEQAKARLSAEHAILLAQQATSPDGILVVNEHGKIISFNQRLVDMWGIPPDVVDSRSDERAWQVVLSKVADPAGLLARIKYLEEHREENGREEIALNDGRSFELHSGPMYGADGTYYGRVWYFRDVTERKRAEQSLERSSEKLRRMMNGTINAITLMVEGRDPYTAGHEKRVAQLACAIATEMGLTADQIEGIRIAGYLHDLGKICVPAEILAKPGRITAIEFSMIKVHPQFGYEILKEIEFTWPVAQATLQHHERLDGSGYPQGLAGGKILIEACILAVADVVEAMSSHRPYRAALGIELALDEISKKTGTLYDPHAVDACLNLLKRKAFQFDAR